MSLREIPVPGWSGEDYLGLEEHQARGAHMGGWFDNNARTPATPMQALMETAPGDEIARSAEEIQQIREAVVDCWQALDQKDSFILGAYDIERLSYSQLAERLGCSKSQAEREHKAAYARLAPFLKAHPIINERFTTLQPTTWNQAASDAVHYLAVKTHTTLPVPFEEAILRGKMILSSGWEETGGRLTDTLIDLGASALGSLTASPDNIETITQLLCDRHAKYGQGNINEFKEYGLLVRMSDKVARIKNHDGANADEATIDACYDLVGYAAIAVMLERGTFTLPLEDAL